MVQPADDQRTLVSTGWLVAHLDDPDLRVLDGSWYLPTAARDAQAEYAMGHIPGAQFFDIDEITDQRSSLPHMAPSPEEFAAQMRAMGVGDGHQVVIYDGSGLFSAARVWWTFRLMGKADVAVLDGGLPKWRSEERAISALPTLVKDGILTPKRQNQWVKDVTQVARAANRGEAVIVDARSAARFSGDAPEPRPGLRSGHIPGSRSVPYTAVLNADGTMKPVLELVQVFQSAGVDLGRPIITTCGSGVTAAILSLVLERVGHKDHALYDGSWSEWGLRDDLAIEKGPPR